MEWARQRFRKSNQPTLQALLTEDNVPNAASLTYNNQNNISRCSKSDKAKITNSYNHFDKSYYHKSGNSSCSKNSQAFLMISLFLATISLVASGASDRILKATGLSSMDDHLVKINDNSFPIASRFLRSIQIYNNNNVKSGKTVGEVGPGSGNSNKAFPDAQPYRREQRDGLSVVGKGDSGLNNSSLLGLRQANPKNKEIDKKPDLESDEDAKNRPILHSNIRNQDYQKHDHLDKSEGDKGHDEEDSLESDRIEILLRDIFIDEFDTEEDPDNALEVVDIEEPYTSLSRSSVNLSNSSKNYPSLNYRNKSQILVMKRFRRSEDEEDEEVKPAVKGRSKKQKGSGVSSSVPDGDTLSGGVKNNKRSKGQRVKSKPKGSDLEKYNDYMDSVFKRMNTMIKAKKMDPLRVNLYAGPSKKAKGKGQKGRNKHAPRMNVEENSEGLIGTALPDEDEDYDVSDQAKGQARRNIFLKLNQDDSESEDEGSEESNRRMRALLEGVSNSTEDPTVHSSSDDSPRGNDSKPKKPKDKQSHGANRGTNKGSKDKDQQGGGKNNKGGNGKGSKNKKVQGGSKPTRGILHGLSSLKRDGNVAVIKQGDKARIVRAKFLLGPVSLEIMPKKSKAGEKTKSVAATAPTLKGVLEVRLKKGSPTRIRKLRVYPPQNVKVEGASQSGTSSKGNKKPKQYGKVTPMATARLRQIASTVVRQADKAHKKKLQS